MKARFPTKLNCGLVAGLFLFVAGCGKKEADATSATEPSAKTISTNVMDRLQWNMDTLVDAYTKVGRRDPKWNEAATNALARFARIRGGGVELDEDQRVLLQGEIREAMQNGCDDPVILYLYARFVARYQSGATAESIAVAHREAAVAMQGVGYPAIRQFYSALRAAEELRRFRQDTEAWPEVSRYRQIAGSILPMVLNDPQIPPGEAYEACRELFAVLMDNPTQFERFYPPIEPLLLQKWPEESFVYLLRGSYRIAAAWKARGTSYSDKVDDEGWKGFGTNLALATIALEKAWQLDPRNPQIAKEMMRVELGEGQGRERLELWFQRAMALDTNYYAACEAKLFYLEPK